MPPPDDYQVCTWAVLLWYFQSFNLSDLFEPPEEGRDIGFPRQHLILEDCTTWDTGSWPPPQGPLGGVLQTACACDLGGWPFKLTWQVDLTNCHLLIDFKRGRRRGWQVSLTSATCQVVPCQGPLVPKTQVLDPKVSFSWRGIWPVKRCGPIAICEEGHCDWKMRWDPIR